MKTPVSYYGGKQRMLRHIIPLIPEHKAYCEPFFGGGALFFAKQPSETEIINDLNGEVVNFYQILKTRFPRLKGLVEQSLHSRLQYDKAWHVVKYPQFFNRVTRAWAFWLCCTLGFSSKLDGTYGYGKADNTVAKKLNGKKLMFDDSLQERVEALQIECTDALRVINSRDTDATFFYLDPPYFNSDCGHYKGYSEQDFIDLLEKCQTLKGKFLLSSYDSEVLKRYADANGWHQKKVEQVLAVNGKTTNKSRTKVEVLTANYPI